MTAGREDTDAESGSNHAIDRKTAMAAFNRSSVAMVLTNPNLPDNPIIYVNQAFERITGYASSAAIGRNCRFLQGERSEARQVDAIRTAVENRETCTVELTNYRASGEAFRNRLIVSPVRSESEDATVYFVGIQMEVGSDEEGVADRDDPMIEIQHRVKNHLAMIVSMIRMEARKGLTAKAEFDTLARRVEALQILYEEMTLMNTVANDGKVQMGSYIGRLATSLANLDGRPGIQIGLNLDDLLIDPDRATRLGLIVSEVLTNAFQHAFEGRDHGRLEIQLTAQRQSGLRLTIADDGVGIPDDVEWPNPKSLGGRIVLGLVKGIDASLDVVRATNGTIVNLDLSGEGHDDRKST